MKTMKTVFKKYIYFLLCDLLHPSCVCSADCTGFFFSRHFLSLFPFSLYSFLNHHTHTQSRCAKIVANDTMHYRCTRRSYGDSIVTVHFRFRSLISFPKYKIHIELDSLGNSLVLDVILISLIAMR